MCRLTAWTLAAAMLLAAGCQTEKTVVVYVDQYGNPIDPPPGLAKGNGTPGTPGNPAANQQPGTPGSPGSPGSPQQSPAGAPVVAPAPHVDKLELESFPSAVNLDDRPGPDGVRVRLRLYSLQQPLAFPLQQGEIEFVLYEGSVKDDDIGDAEPFHTWRYSAAQLAGATQKTLVGLQYDLPLRWLEHVPSTNVVTLIARIPRPNAAPLYARPVHLAMGPR